MLDVTDAAHQAAAAGVDELHALVNNANITVAMPLEVRPARRAPTSARGQPRRPGGRDAGLPAPTLQRARGRIVFVGSIAGKARSWARASTRAEAVADSLRLELRPWGIGVSIVEPGSIKTPIWARGAAKPTSCSSSIPRAADLYGERVAAPGRVAAKRGAGSSRRKGG